MLKISTSLLIVLPLISTAQAWNTSGNAGTSPTSNFIGTTDNQSLVIKTNNTEQIAISQSGRLSFYGLSGLNYNKNIYIGGGNEYQQKSGEFDSWTFAGNVAVGIGSLSNVLAGSNTAVGFNSMNSTTSGVGNTALGINALQSNISGNSNIGIGVNGGAGAKGNNNIAVGIATLWTDNSGSNNVVVGTESFRYINGSSSNNTSLGYRAGYGFRSGNNNILLGSFTNTSSPNASNELNIGNWIYGNNGQISIGGRASFTCADCSKYSLFVKNGIKAEQVKVDIASTNGWADYVFHKDYRLSPLQEVEEYIGSNGHLPNIPSAEEVAKDGLNLGEMDAKLLSKIEELTLYIIEQGKRLDGQNQKINELQKEISALKTPNSK